MMEVMPSMEAVPLVWPRLVLLLTIWTWTVVAMLHKTVAMEADEAVEAMEDKADAVEDAGEEAADEMDGM